MTAFLLVVLFLAGSLAPGAVAQTPGAAPPDLTARTETDVDFPRGISFSATIEVDNPAGVESIELLYRPVTGETLHMALVPATSLKVSDTAIALVLAIDLQQDFLPAGMDLRYFWRLHFTEGTIADSAPESVSWIDNRFIWSSTSTDQVTVHSYALSDEFAQYVAANAQSTMTELESRFDLLKSAPISIWIYENSSDFREAMPANSREAVAGGSYPGDLIIHAVIPDGNEREVGRTITHEVSHQVLFQATANPYALPPLWFDEGMATHAQTAGTSGYLPLAVYAAEMDQVFKLSSLQSGFPFQPDKAAIAYAVSWSAVEYIQYTWGDQGIAGLIDAFATGTPVDDAVEQKLGITMDELDTDLRKWLTSHITQPAVSISNVQ
jgi:hypothetical protein